MEKPANSVPALSQLAFMDEALAVCPMLSRLEPLAAIEPAIKAQAIALTESVRTHGTHGVETLLNAYGLNSEEGVALMCLAEALLRIPDAATADAMIEDTLNHHWERYTHSDSWMVSLSGWGLLVGGKVASLQDAKSGIGGTIKNMVGRLGEPIMREALKKSMRLIGDKFVLGETVAQALTGAKPYQKRGYRFSFDILGEGARSDAQAQDYVAAYREAIALIGNAGSVPLFEASSISVKLSAFHPRYQLAQQQRVMSELLPRLKEIILLAKQNNIAVSIDAEESTRLDIEMLVFEQLLADPAFAGWNGIGFVLQAYQKRAFHIVDWLADLAGKHTRKIPVRLVKGAYWDYEIKTAQMQGLPSLSRLHPQGTHRMCPILPAPTNSWRGRGSSTRNSPPTTPTRWPVSCRWPNNPAGKKKALSCNASSAWAKHCTTLPLPKTPPASTPPSVRIRICWRTSSAACWKTAPIVRSCTS